MYSIDDLLQIVKDEQADELRLSVGGPPILVIKDELQSVEGPALTLESIEQLLQSLANSRQRRLLRNNGSAQFLYTLRKTTPFLVKAVLKDEEVRLTIS